MVLRTRKGSLPSRKNPLQSLFRLNWPIVAVLVLFPASLFAQAAGQSYKIEPAGPPRVQIPHELRNSLETEGIRLLHRVNGVDRPLAELWPIRSLTVRPSGKSPEGAAYGQLIPGKLLAVLYLPITILDVRFQKVPPGYYILRYALLDRVKGEDGLGQDEIEEGKPIIRKYHDYVFLTRMESEKPAGADLAVQKMSGQRQGSPGKPPALLALPPLNPNYSMFPYAISDDRGHCSVQLKFSLLPGPRRAREMGIAILLVNPPNLSEDD